MTSYANDMSSVFDTFYALIYKCVVVRTVESQKKYLKLILNLNLVQKNNFCGILKCTYLVKMYDYVKNRENTPRNELL